MNTNSSKIILYNAVVKSVSGKYAVYACQLLSMVILARVFTPEQFGVFAVIQVFAVFFALFSEIGLLPAIVNQTKISAEMRNGLFGLSAFLGFIVFIAFFSSSNHIASFYDYEGYNILIVPVALSVLFSSLSTVPLASFVREKFFIRIAQIELVSELVSLVIVLVLVSALDPVLSLACKPLIVSILKFSQLWFYSKNTEVGRPFFSLGFNQVKPLLNFSIFQFLSNIMVFFSRNLDNLLVGKYFGSSNLGYYDKAYQLMRYPLMLLSFAMAPAIQPVLNKFKEDKVSFSKLHNDFILKLSVISGLIGIAFVFLSDFIVYFLLGENWADVAVLLSILSVSIPIQVVGSTSGGFYQAASRTDLLFKCTLFSFITNVSAIVISIIFGDLSSLCWALVISFTINFIQCYYVFYKNISDSDLSGLLKPLFVTFVFSALILLINVFK